MLQVVFYSNLSTFPGGSDDKQSACNVGDLGSTSGSGRSPGEENGYPLQLSCLENPMDRGAWQATVHRVATSQRRLKLLSIHTYRPQNQSFLQGFLGISLNGGRLSLFFLAPLLHRAWTTDVIAYASHSNKMTTCG